MRASRLVFLSVLLSGSGPGDAATLHDVATAISGWHLAVFHILYTLLYFLSSL